MTPEAKVKRAVSAILRGYDPDVYYIMPVANGFGRSTLDFIGFVHGLGFAIETKRPGGRPTLRQKGVIESIERAGGKVFVIDGPTGMAQLMDWLSTVTRVEQTT